MRLALMSALGAFGAGNGKSVTFATSHDMAATSFTVAPLRGRDGAWKIATFSANSPPRLSQIWTVAVSTFLTCRESS